MMGGIQRCKISAGFTLIEMLVVVLIISILAAIAYPSYRENVLKSKRTDVKTVLLDAAQYLERNNTVSGRYDKDSAGTAITLPSGFAVAPRGATGVDIAYNIALTTLTSSTYTLQATPANQQVKDKCGKLTLNSVGVKGVIDNTAYDAFTCWN